MSNSTLTQVVTGNKLFTPHQRVVVGVSGGPDSMALLLLLTDSGLNLDCIAAYIDHGLRPQETSAEKEAVKKLARMCRARFCLRTIPVREYATAHGLSIEEAARTLRYRALEEIRLEYDAEVIAVAHTADDQVEEFLLRMIRGCGRNGLTGMRPRRDRIVRPLLSLAKKELVDYLTKHGIAFCVDSSNLDRRFLRNRIRLDLLPVLEEHFNPSIRRTILQAMDILQDEEDLLDRLTREALPVSDGRFPDSIVFPLDSLRTRHPAIRRRMIEQVCWTLGARPTYRQIALVLSLLEGKRTGTEVHLSGGLRIEKTSDALLFSYPRGKKAFRGSGGESVEVDIKIAAPGLYPVPELDAVLEISEGKQTIPSGQAEGLVVDAELVVFPLHLHTIVAGQRFRPFGGAGSKKINRFLNDRGIPASKRHLYPVLSMHGDVLALPGITVDDRFRTSEATRKTLVITWRTGEKSGLPE